MSNFIYDNVKTLKLGDKRVLRVINKEKAVFPNVVKNELALWYDFKGYTNQNANRGVAHDYSGNGRNGTLQNFLFNTNSGYDNGLIFDNVDDFIQIPELNLDADNYSVQINDKIYSFRGENTATVVDDGIEVGGRNYIKNGKEQYQTTPKQYKLTSELRGNLVLSLNWDVPTSESIPDNILVWVQKDGVNSFYERVEVQGQRKGFGEIKVNTEEGTVTHINIFAGSSTPDSRPIFFRNIKLEKGTIATDWTPAPEDLLTTQFKTTEKLKSLRYWNRALTDEELITMYNIEKQR